MRISKDLASRITDLILKEKSELLKKRRVDVEQALKYEYLGTLPSDVGDFYISYPEYFQTDIYATSEKKGISAYIRNVPKKDHAYIMSDSLESKFFELKQEKEKISSIRCDLETSIYECRTIRNAVEAFPDFAEIISSFETQEAKRFLPSTIDKSVIQWIKSNKP